LDSSYPEEPFGISIVEALSAGLIPIVPDNGGATEFVPPQYQYRTIEDASNMIYKILKNINSKYDGKIEIEKQKIKKLANKFSKQKFNENVTRVIESILENNTFSDSLSSQSFVVLNHPVIIE
jgi:glycosyltransferase involved in cell wall biosynthesis